MRFSTGNRIASILLFILISASGGESGHPCPPPNNSSSCKCNQIETPSEAKKAMEEFEIPSNNSFFTEVDCENLTSFQTMQYIIRSEMNRMLIDKLVIKNLLPGKIEEAKTETFIKGGLFQNSRIRRFEVRDSVLDNNFIGLERPFRGEEHCLVSFAAINCSLQGILSYDMSFSITTKGFSTLSKLEEIDFSQNEIVRIDKSAFQNPPRKLRKLNLSRNNIEEIDKRAFERICGLKVLDLSHNNLLNVERNLFSSPNSSIEVLDLSWNRLQELPHDLFDGMPSLKIVNMEKNFLFSLSVKPWQTVWDHLTHVYLYGNFIECDCDIAWLLKDNNDTVTNKTVNSTTGNTTTTPSTTTTTTTAKPKVTGRTTLNETTISVSDLGPVDLKGRCYVSINHGNQKRTLLNLELYDALQVVQENCLPENELLLKSVAQ